MDKAEIPFLPVTQLRELIKNREVSPVEVVESYLERIDGLNDRLYAYLTVCSDQALQSARESEQALVRGESRGPLHGIPVAVKDQLNTAGILGGSYSGDCWYHPGRSRIICRRLRSDKCPGVEVFSKNLSPLVGFS